MVLRDAPLVFGNSVEFIQRFTLLSEGLKVYKDGWRVNFQSEFGNHKKRGGSDHEEYLAEVFHHVCLACCRFR